MRKEVVFLICLLLLPVVYAGFTVEEQNIISDYTAGEIIRGTITLDLAKEPANNLITSTFAGNISLINLIRQNGYVDGQEYFCSTPNCIDSYKVTQQSVNQISLDDEEYIGFNLTGREVSVESLDFTIASNAPASCTKQLVIDVFNEGKTLIQNNQYTTAYQCSDVKKYGCFDLSLNQNSYSNLKVGEQSLCEKITLNAGPAFEVGAKIMNSSNGKTAKLKMEMYDANISFVGGCELPVLQQTNQEVSCIINKSILETGAYYVCINSDNGEANYNILGEEQGEVCGTADLFGSQEEFYDYEIYSRPLPYAPLTSMKLSEAFESATGEDISFYVDDYIQNYYNRNCTSGCIVPFKLEGLAQSISITDISVVYETSFGNVKTQNTISKLQQTDPTINANDLVLEIQPANFIASGNGIKKADFFLAGKKIFNTSLQFNIAQGFNFTVNPRFSLIGIPTQFNLVGANVSTVIWNFGDGSQEITQINNVKHTYNQAGNYTLQVTATSSSGVTTKRSFVIYAGNAKESANQLYNITQKNLANVSSFVESRPSWIKTKLEEKIRLNEKRQALVEINKALNNASSDSDYSSVITAILNLDVPQNLNQRRSGQVPLALSLNNIDLRYLESISESGVPVGKDDEVKDSLVYWINQYYNPEIKYYYINQVMDSGEESELVSVFTLVLNEKQTPTDSVTFFLDYPNQETLFMQDYSQKSVGSGIIQGSSIELRNPEITFAIFDGVEVSELGMFISPAIERLGTFEESVIEAPKYPTKLVVSLIILILIVFFVLYILVQEWYKKHYERYLFKNADDLYNVITFIHNARVSNISDDQSRKKLSDSKWSGEQISYAFKKLDGKRTGMLEIPIFRFFEKRKINQEIAKRQGKNGERFIKR